MKLCTKCGEFNRDQNGRCKTCKKVRDKARYEKNTAQIKEKTKKWLEANSDRNRKTQAEYRAKNPELCAGTSKKWKMLHPEAVSIQRQNRRSLVKAASGKLSDGIVEKLLNLQKGLCPCCKKKLGNSYHLDHIIPLALGGSNSDENIQLLRSTCNMQKNAKHPVDFMQSRGFLL